jgi:3-hydroxybutyryl-CoA dehydrogenase
MRAVGVIGAGQMGAGIAQVSAGAGYHVYLSDLDLAKAEDGKAGIAKALDRLVAKEKMAQDAADMLLSRIEPVGSYEPMADAGLIIEAATEREEIKRNIFKAVGGVLGHQAVLASNTSSIPITRLAQSSPEPKRFIGVHFFNPVPVMGLQRPTLQLTSYANMERRWASSWYLPMTRRVSSSIGC